MADAHVNYAHWDIETLIDSFNAKAAPSFFDSERHFLDALDLATLDGVLDVGCSCGRFVELLRSRGYQSHYTGVDISVPSVEIGRRNYPDLEFFAGNYLEFPTRHRYDLVNATGVVQHEPNYQALVGKMLRDSARYVLFDAKLCDVPEPIADINRCYCESGNSRIHMVCFSLSHLIDFVSGLPECGEISVFGYPTKPNAATVGPADVINNWASCGVFIDKSKPRGVGDIRCPDLAGSAARPRG
jgi:SAM-dependent methyltransferase